MDSSRDGEDNFISHLPDDIDDEPVEDGGSEYGEGNDMLAAESVEQYVRLHEHIERLRADRAPLRPDDTLSADEAQAYQMAAFFRAAAPDASEPDATFVANLRKRLMQDDTEAPRPGKGATAPLPERAEKPPVERRPEVTRRGLLGVGLGAAAAFIGAAAGAAVQRELQGQGTTATPPDVKIVPDGRGIWVAVAAVSDLPVGAVRRFTTESLVGFVRHTTEGFSALSGTCTHMGCLLLWNAGERTYDCPCHGGRFAEDGSSATSSRVAYRPLPPVATRVMDGHVWVYAAPPIVAPPATNGTEPPYSGGVDTSSGDTTSHSTADNWSR